MNPIFLDLGFVTIRYYGLFYALGFYLSILIARRESIRLKADIEFDYVLRHSVRGFLFAILGARLYFVLFNFDWYFGPNAAWYEFLAFWKGGLAIHGGLIAAFLYVIWLTRQQHCRVKTAGLLDYVCFFTYMSQVLGRLGNFMNGDAHGLPTELPWGMVFKYGPASLEYPNIPLHPVMLYEAGLNFVWLIFIWNIRKKGFKLGFLAALSSILVSVSRFFVSFFRADDLYVFVKTRYGTTDWLVQYSSSIEWGIKAPHVMSVIIILASLFCIFKFKLYQIDNTPYPYNKSGKASPIYQ